MNIFETELKEYLESKGVIVYQSGWPDFLCVKRSPHSAEACVFAVEAKCGADKVRENQAKIHQVLHKAGIPVYVLNPEWIAAGKSHLPGKAFFSKGTLEQMNKYVEHLRNEQASLQERIDNLSAQIETSLIGFVPSEELYGPLLRRERLESLSPYVLGNSD